jgi:GntR family transcriptional regulator, transcriptional repressor for pyruvate dehydrogenase complex
MKYMYHDSLATAADWNLGESAMTTEASARPSPPSDAARRIRQYILRRRLQPGDQLPTHDKLSRQLKVGQRRLREGLSILRHQGIVETRNKGGTIVRQPTIRTLGEPITWHLDAAGCKLEDIVSARAWLESGAAAEAAQKRTARDLLVILDALERLEAAADSPHGDMAEEEAFHLAILQATHNSVIVTFSQLVSMQFQDRTREPDPAEHRHFVNREQHRCIYEAIERQDPTAARDLMYIHVMGQLNSLPKQEDKP